MQSNRSSLFVFSRMASAMVLSSTISLALVACGGGQAPGGGEAASQELVAAGAVETESPADEAALWAKGAALNAADLKAASQAEGSAAAKASAAVATAKALTPVTVYRFYNQNTSAHFYTSSVTERDAVRASVPYMTYEGAAFQASSQSDTGLSPVFRFLNQQTGVHFYTISASERDHIVANLPQYRLEGVAYYASQVAERGFARCTASIGPGRGFTSIP
ncbi:MAG: hypothetical protein R3E42_13030 [Burkholderiaceae bacterium]